MAYPDAESANTSSPSLVSLHTSLSSHPFVEVILVDFSHVLNKEDSPLTNKEYMQLTELKFLLKNIRELTAIQLFQSFSRSDTITYTPTAAVHTISSIGASTTGASTINNINSAYSTNERNRINSVYEGNGLNDVTEGNEVKRTSTDRSVLLQRRDRLDAILQARNPFPTITSILTLTLTTTFSNHFPDSNLLLGPQEICGHETQENGTFCGGKGTFFRRQGGYE